MAIATGPLVPVKIPQINTPYHVTWGKSNGVVGICISVDEITETVTLRNPKTRTIWKCRVKWSDLHHTRKNQINNPH